MPPPSKPSPPSPPPSPFDSSLFNGPSAQSDETVTVRLTTSDLHVAHTQESRLIHVDSPEAKALQIPSQKRKAEPPSNPEANSHGASTKKPKRQPLAELSQNTSAAAFQKPRPSESEPTTKPRSAARVQDDCRPPNDGLAPTKAPPLLDASSIQWTPDLFHAPRRLKNAVDEVMGDTSRNRVLDVLDTGLRHLFRNDVDVDAHEEGQRRFMTEMPAAILAEGGQKYQDIINMSEAMKEGTEGMMYANYATLHDVEIQTPEEKAVYNLSFLRSSCMLVMLQCAARWIDREFTGEKSDVVCDNVIVMDACLHGFTNTNKKSPIKGYRKNVKEAAADLGLTVPQYYLVKAATSWLEIKRYFLKNGKPMPVLVASTLACDNLFASEGPFRSPVMMMCGNALHGQNYLIGNISRFSEKTLNRINESLSLFFHHIPGVNIPAGAVTSLAHHWGTKMPPEEKALLDRLRLEALVKAWKTTKETWRAYNNEEELSDEQRTHVDDVLGALQRGRDTQAKEGWPALQRGRDTHAKAWTARDNGDMDPDQEAFINNMLAHLREISHIGAKKRWRSDEMYEWQTAWEEPLKNLEVLSIETVRSALLAKMGTNTPVDVMMRSKPGREAFVNAEANGCGKFQITSKFWSSDKGFIISPKTAGNGEAAKTRAWEESRILLDLFAVHLKDESSDDIIELLRGLVERREVASYNAGTQGRASTTSMHELGGKLHSIFIANKGQSLVKVEASLHAAMKDFPTKVTSASLGSTNRSSYKTAEDDGKARFGFRCPDTKWWKRQEGVVIGAKARGELEAAKKRAQEEAQVIIQLLANFFPNESKNAITGLLARLLARKRPSTMHSYFQQTK